MPRANLLRGKPAVTRLVIHQERAVSALVRCEQVDRTLDVLPELGVRGREERHLRPHSPMGECLPPEPRGTPAFERRAQAHPVSCGEAPEVARGIEPSLRKSCLVWVIESLAHLDQALCKLVESGPKVRRSVLVGRHGRALLFRRALCARGNANGKRAGIGTRGVRPTVRLAPRKALGHLLVSAAEAEHALARPPDVDAPCHWVILDRIDVEARGLAGRGAFDSFRFRCERSVDAGKRASGVHRNPAVRLCHVYHTQAPGLSAAVSKLVLPRRRHAPGQERIQKTTGERGVHTVLLRGDVAPHDERLASAGERDVEEPALLGSSSLVVCGLCMAHPFRKV